MGVGLNRYLYYKGVYYDTGTKVKIKTKWDGDVITTFLGNGQYEGLGKYSFYSAMPPEHYIIEIVEPVYYKAPEIDSAEKSSVFTQTGSGSWNSHDEVFNGLIWYIAVMLIGTIFNDRWLIWIIATVVFFSWKSKK